MGALRVALVGCGIISRQHLHAYRAFSGRAIVVACCDIDFAKAVERAETVGARATMDFESILSDPNIDAVDICTPPHLHTEAVISALRAGKHVSCQKPLARTLEECDRMIEAANESGKILFYAEIMRTMPAGHLAAQSVREGRIGELVGVQATYAHLQSGAYLSTAWRYDPKIAGGGMVLDAGIHHLNLLKVVGGEVESVSCMTRSVRPELGGEDTAVINLRFEGGYLGSLFATQSAGLWYSGHGFVAYGTEGILTIGGGEGALVLHREDLPDRKQVLMEKSPELFTAMIGHFLEVVDGAPNLCPAELGREDLRLVLASYRSAELRQEVRISDIH